MNRDDPVVSMLKNVRGLKLIYTEEVDKAIAIAEHRNRVIEVARRVEAIPDGHGELVIGLGELNEELSALDEMMK